MEISKIFRHIVRNGNIFCSLKRYPIKTDTLNFHSMSAVKNLVHNSKVTIINDLQLSQKFHEGVHDDDSLCNGAEPMENFYPSHTYAKHLLYKNSNDSIIVLINNCASIQELFNVVKENVNFIHHEHLTQAVLVLHDFKTILFNIVDEHPNPNKNFMDKLLESKDFNFLLDIVESNINKFDCNNICYVFYYLNQLGLSIQNKLMQMLLKSIKSNLLECCDLSQASKFLRTVFTESTSCRPYYIAQGIIPLIFNKIDNCNKLEEFNELTICLNKLNNVVNTDVLGKYKNKLRYLIDQGVLKPQHYDIILNIVMFLNYPQWRIENRELVCECILLTKTAINHFNPVELMTLFDIFDKNREPSDVLNEIQRTASRHFNAINEEPHPNLGIQLRLLASLVFFTQPMNRAHYESIINTHINEYKTFEHFLILQELLSFIKTSDKQLCDLYWANVLKLLETEEHSINRLIKICENYIYFNVDINNYRNWKIEKKLLEMLRLEFENGIVSLLPSKLCKILCFHLIYGRDSSLLKLLIEKTSKHCLQLGPQDCFNLTQSLRIATENRIALDLQDTQTLGNVIDQVLEKEMKSADIEKKMHLLFRTAILRNNKLLEPLAYMYTDKTYMSSKTIEHVTQCFLNGNIFIPEVANNLAEYVVNNKKNVIGFNAIKVLYMCYNFGHQPENPDFFETVVDITLRNQERLSGLAFLQCALALCYFEKLPTFFAKMIFNVEFLEKIDNELSNCYSKDKYPSKVRKSIMHLNRAVCLEYPEANIPWFHKKYLEEIRDKASKKNHSSVFSATVKDSLIKLVSNPNQILDNVLAPYGYSIDFVINFDHENEIMDDDSNNVKTKLAILLVRRGAYSRIVEQLKGKHQFKIRHLGMLGYKVVLINFKEWFCLVHTEAKLDYLTKLLWPTRDRHLFKTSIS